MEFIMPTVTTTMEATEDRAAAAREARADGMAQARAALDLARATRRPGLSLGALQRMIRAEARARQDPAEEDPHG